MAIYDGNGNQLPAVYDGGGVELEYAYDGLGNVIYSKEAPVPPSPPKYDYDDYSISDLFTYGVGSAQAFAVYNGVIAQVKQTNALHIVDISTQSKIKEVAMDTGHGNSCQFSEEFYNLNDEFPLFYVRNDGIWVYRITGTASSLIKKYAFSTDVIGTYVAGFGVDSANKRLYTVSYTEGTYTSKTGLCRFCAFDMDDVTESGDSTYSMKLLYSYDSVWFDRFEAIQGACYHDGYLFVATGMTGSQQYIVLFDVTTGTISHVITIGNTVETEGCAWVDNDYMIISQNPNSITYKKVEFAELQS